MRIGRSKQMRAQVTAGIHAPVLAITRLLQRGQRLGSISKRTDPAIIARTIVAMFQGFVLQRVWGEPFEAPAALLGFEALLRGLETCTEPAKKKPAASR